MGERVCARETTLTLPSTASTEDDLSDVLPIPQLSSEKIQVTTSLTLCILVQILDKNRE